VPSLGSVCVKNSEREVLLSVLHVSLAPMCELVLEINVAEDRSALIWCDSLWLNAVKVRAIHDGGNPLQGDYRVRCYVNLEHPREFDCRPVEPCLFTDLTKSKGQKRPKIYVLIFYVIKRSEYFVSL